MRSTHFLTKRDDVIVHIDLEYQMPCLGNSTLNCLDGLCTAEGDQLEIIGEKSYRYFDPQDSSKSATVFTTP